MARAPVSVITTLGIVSLGLPLFGQDLPDPSVIPLIPGQVLVREIMVRETHRYSIELRAGEYAQLLVEQRGADLEVAVTAPDGGTVLQTDNPCGLIGPDPVAFTAPADGVYVLSLKANEIAVPPRGGYEIRVEAVREPTSRDLLRIRAILAAMEARRSFPKEPAAGVELFRESAAAWREFGDRRLQMWMEMAAGVGLAQFLDQFQEAAESYLPPLAIALELGDEWAEARIRYNIAQSMRRLGRLDEAAEHFERALSLHRAAGREVAGARVLTSLASSAMLAGEPQRALDLFDEALQSFQAAGIARNEAITRSDIAIAYLRLNDPEPALEHCRLALPTFAQEPGFRAKCMLAIGRAHFQLGDLGRAREAYTEALGIYKSLGSRVSEADTYLSVGDLQVEEGDLQAAREAFASALAVYRDRAYPLGEGLSHCRLGDVGLRLGDREAARQAFEAALAIAPAASAFVSACAEAGLARVAREAGELAAARASAEKALARAESLRAQVVSPHTRAAALASHQSLYELLIDVLLRQHAAEPSRSHDVAAFEMSERARARGLLELLAESRVHVRQGVDPETLAEERSLRRSLNTTAQEEEQALTAGRLDRAESLGREVDSLLARLVEVEARIRRGSPRYAALTQAQPLTLAEIRSQVLDSDTQLLQYALGEPRSYLWVVSPARLESFSLAPRAEIERASRRLHALVSAPPGAIGRGATGAEGGPATLEAATRELSRLLLAPAAGTLTGKRLLVVAPGALQYVPFASLPLPDGLPAGSPEPGAVGGSTRSAAAGASDTPDLLVSRFELVSAPSASVIASLRSESTPRRPATKIAAVFADPVFEPSDPRLAAALRGGRGPAAMPAGSRGSEPAGALERALRGLRATRTAGLGRLPFSRQEAEAIVALASPSQSTKAIGFEANRAAATSPQLAGYRVVHFATHGVLNAQRPELSGVVLSLFDRAGRKQDGFLRLHDIYNLELSADLVVLSGCQTALGKDLAGEGLVGLTRGFMYAGARRVVATLWQVDDQSTAELMKRFYRAVLKEGRRPADALRLAQMEMARDRRWSAPFYWAAFVLQGEWR